MITEAARASKGGRILSSFEECLLYLAAPDCPCFAPDAPAAKAREHHASATGESAGAPIGVE